MSRRRSLGSVLRQWGDQGSFEGPKTFVGGYEAGSDAWAGNMHPLMRALLRRSGAMPAPRGRARKGRPS